MAETPKHCKLLKTPKKWKKNAKSMTKMPYITKNPKNDQNSRKIEQKITKIKIIVKLVKKPGYD